MGRVDGASFRVLHHTAVIQSPAVPQVGIDHGDSRPGELSPREINEAEGGMIRKSRR